MSEYVPEHQLPTQVLHPWRATLRTTIAAVISIIVVIPLTWAIISDEVAKNGLVLPDRVVDTVNLALCVLAVVVGAITRIMAIPAVNAILTNGLNLGAVPNLKE